MRVEKERQQDLKGRTKQYALRIIKLYAAIPKSAEAQVIGKQLLRSGTSVGAHYREAQRAKSDADFISKIEGALQELDETCYWLELLHDGSILPPSACWIYSKRPVSSWPSSPASSSRSNAKTILPDQTALMSFILQPSSFILAFALAAIVSGLAYRAHALTLSGAAAAAIEGTLIFGLGGIPAAALLLAFFISSSLLSRLFARQKTRFNEKFSKGSRRDAAQVLANGGLATLFIILTALFPDQAWPWVGFAASLAAVNADTWATEIGVLSPSEPRLITTGQIVERGASGGVSLTGLLAALAGAGLIALLAVLFAGNPLQTSIIALVILSLAGLAGSLLDSLLGASVQAIYYCPTCQKETERHPAHTCGSPTALVRGWRWLNNDWVNVACSVAGAGLAIAALLLYPGWYPAAGPTELLSPTGEQPMTFPISSTAFEEGKLIPARHTCDGQNLSPMLSWRDLPPATRSLALITDDPDSPGGTFTHWVLYNLPPALTVLPEGIDKTASVAGIGAQGTNSFGRTGYDGPCPPHGSVHRYYFRLYALDIDPTLPAGLNANQLRKELQGHVLGEAQWIGRYARP